MDEIQETTQEELQKVTEMLMKIQQLLGRIEEYVDVTLDVTQSTHPLRSYALQHLGNESSGKILYSKFLNYRSTNPGPVTMGDFGKWIFNGMRDNPIRPALPRRERNRTSRSSIKRIVVKRRRRCRKVNSTLP